MPDCNIAELDIVIPNLRKYGGQAGATAEGIAAY